MRILFLSINNLWNPHFETELELMTQHMELGDEVYVLTCPQSLPTCSSNPNNLKVGCLKCRSRFKQGMKKINIPSQNIMFLKKKNQQTQSYPVFSSMDELKNFTLNGVAIVLAVASSLISELRESNVDTRLYKKKIAQNINAAVLMYESVYDSLKKVKPDVFYVFNGRFVDSAPAIEACKQLGIPFYTHDRGGKITTYSLFENCTPHTALNLIKEEIEHYWQNGGADKELIGEKWFNDRRNGAEQAWYSFVKNQSRNLLPEGFDTQQINIVIYNTSVDEYETFSEWKDPIYSDESKALTAIIEAFLSNSSIKFYFRVHPCLKGIENTQMKKLRDIEAKGYKNLTFIWPYETIDSYALLLNSDKVLVFASTVGVEACFWGKPSILIGRAFYEGVDCCYMPTSHAEVVSLISSELAPKNKLGALKYAYWEETRGIRFEKFKPTGLFKGAFLGEEIKPKFNIKDKLLLKIYNRLDNWKINALAKNKKREMDE